MPHQIVAYILNFTDVKFSPFSKSFNISANLTSSNEFKISHVLVLHMSQLFSFFGNIKRHIMCEIITVVLLHVARTV